VLDSTRETQTRSHTTFGDYVELCRPTQWIKNVVVFAGPAGALQLFTADGFLRSLMACSAFCLAASATYAINDAVDRVADAIHPIKRIRPVARGAISPAAAFAVGAFLLVLGVALAWMATNSKVAIVVVAYFLMSLSYSFGLKRRMILDVIIIATGFVLRAWAGSLAVGVVTSEWLVACVFTLCLFLGFGKRRCEIAMIGNTEEAGRHRRTLLKYTPDLLNHLITVSAGIAIMTFLLYTLDSSSVVPFHKEHLFYSLPVVVYGIFRFAMLSEAGHFSGPTEIVLKDKAMLATIVVWAVIALLIAYQERLFGGGGLTTMLRSP